MPWLLMVNHSYFIKVGSLGKHVLYSLLTDEVEEKHTSRWLEESKGHCMLIGRYWKTLNSDWRRVKQWCLGLHSCSCWTEPALDQHTDTSSAGTRRHSPQSFRQNHTIVIIQMIWEDLPGQVAGMVTTLRLVCKDSDPNLQLIEG